jgi:hypothetical protein
MPKFGAYLSLNFFEVLAARAVEVTVETATAAAAAEAIKLRRVIFLRLFISALLKLTFIVLLHSPPSRVCNYLLSILTIKGEKADIYQHFPQSLYYNF